MSALPQPWDYLILTAANQRQAKAYTEELRLRCELGRLPQVRQSLVVPDLQDRRMGSGGSTLLCLAEVLQRQAEAGGRDAERAQEVFRGKRILIVHGGGDSRRLPAYSAIGKIFTPLPEDAVSSALPLTLFDRLVPRLLSLPFPGPQAGQIVVATGDALIEFDPAALDLAPGGISVLGAHASAEEAAGHGVFCVGQHSELRLYLQKPSPERQREAGALDRQGRSALDLGVMSFDAATALQLLRIFHSGGDQPGVAVRWDCAARDAMLAHGIDLYREISCALGSDATHEHYVRAVRASGGAIGPGLLGDWFAALNRIPVRVQLVEPCRFLHFGTTRQLISSGRAVSRESSQANGLVIVNCEITAAVEEKGSDAWLEACRVRAPLRLAGQNVAIGLDVAAPLDFPAGACLDVTPGMSRSGRPVFFVRCCGVDDDFKKSLDAGATVCGMALENWMQSAGALPEEVWPSEIAPAERSLWNARLFPAEPHPADFSRWLWMWNVGSATAEQKRAFVAADRYSCAEIAFLARSDQFRARRAAIRANAMRRRLPRMFAPTSDFSARDLAFALEHSHDRSGMVSEVLASAELAQNRRDDPLGALVRCRVAHSLGTALRLLAERGIKVDLPAVALSAIAAPNPSSPAATEANSEERLRRYAFHTLAQVIVAGTSEPVPIPRHSLRPDECVWGRAPARIELGGGWTDTPPYTLEFGGHVTNTAINLNGQPPIHCFARVTPDRVIRLHSTDSGQHLEITQLQQLLDYRKPGDAFALAKAALALSGFSPEFAPWPEGATLAHMLAEFGGGIELTTLVGIPQGSGLGTSSILGAVILAVVQRMGGQRRSPRQLFHEVLRLEQALTTGGGWQDQVGGCVGGSKITATSPGVVPDPMIEALPSTALDPQSNGGCTLLYYTGITRLAKNILQEIVGAYLDRDPAILAALAEEHAVAQAIAHAMRQNNIARLGAGVDAAWELQKRLCGTVTNEAIESLLRRVRPHVHGMRISGAGSGGFLLMICKTPQDAAQVRAQLEKDPLNERARFFEFGVNHAGLEVSTC